jgi:RNA polymerase sporulation-specific sigma factor
MGLIQMELNEYLQELKTIKMLKIEEETLLWQAYKINHEMNARQILIESYQPLVFKAVMQLKAADNVMDLVQEGTVGLIEAVENYDHSRSVAFSLYALHRIRGRMLNFLQKEGLAELTYIDRPMYNEDNVTTLCENIIDPAPAVSKQVEQQFLVDQLKDAMQRLPKKEQLVLQGVYMKNQEVKEVAETLELSTTHIYRLQKRGIQRIRGMLSNLMKHW